MQRKMVVVGIGLLFIAFVVVKLVKLNNKEKAESEFIKENYIEVSAMVKQVMRSGTRNKLTTILQVEYIYENEKQNATIRRNGYIENAYNKGDTIRIFINPNNTAR